MMSVRPIPRRDGRARRPRRLAGATLLTATLALAACATPPAAPDGVILSRLPPGSPGAAAPRAAAPLPDAEEQARRYEQIDRQALKDSEDAIRVDEAARQARALAAQSSVYYGYGWGGPAYYGWAPGWYGAGWYGGSWYGGSWYGGSWYGGSWYGGSWYGGGWGGRGWRGGPRSGVFIGQRWGW